MAVRGHQDLVVIELLKQGLDVNQVNDRVSHTHLQVEVTRLDTSSFDTDSLPENTSAL